LTDSRNTFNQKLLADLAKAVTGLKKKCREAGSHIDVNVVQIDYTQDLKGFFMSVDVMGDLKKLSPLIGIPYSRGPNGYT
jgi:hypothetical protein